MTNLADLIDEYEALLSYRYRLHVERIAGCSVGNQGFSQYLAMVDVP